MVNNIKKINKRLSMYMYIYNVLHGLLEEFNFHIVMIRD